MGASDIATLVKQAVDIIDVVSQAVPLRRVGNRHVGLCPFHQEKTPSFYVNADIQRYYCFGCGSSGDVLAFVMKYRNSSFSEAIDYLADRYHITLPDKDFLHDSTGGMAEATRKERQELYDIMGIAADYYYGQLHHSETGKAARDYVLQRRLPPKVLETERIGYAPDLWDGLLRYLDGLGVDTDLGVKAGLLARNTGNRVFDRFRHRLMFPIRDDQNRIVAFGGRILSRAPHEHDTNSGYAGREEPKYLNSPETPLFHKGRVLYQLARARDACRQSRQAVLVEGYMDLLAFHSHEFFRVVATLGTALTSHQVRLLSRIVDEVILAYDGDDAGEKAMIRALPFFLQEELTVTCVRFPDGLDPDDFLKKNGLNGFDLLLQQRLDLGTYAIRKSLEAWDGSTGGKAKVMAELQPLIDSVRQPVLKSEYMHLIADRLSLSERVVEDQFRHARKDSPKPSRTIHAASPPLMLQTDSLEENVVRSMIRYPHLIGKVKGSAAVACFRESRLKDLAEALLRVPYPPDGVFSASAVFDLLLNNESKDLLTRFLLESGDLEGAQFHMQDWLDALTKRSIGREREATIEALRRAESEGNEIERNKYLAQLQSRHSAKKEVKGIPNV